MAERENTNGMSTKAVDDLVGSRFKRAVGVYISHVPELFHGGETRDLAKANLISKIYDELKEADEKYNVG